jgi:hypothetical protein
MATAWARLAFNEEFTSPAADGNAASSPDRREKGANQAAEDPRNLLDEDKLIDCTSAGLAFNEEFTSPAADEHSDRQPPKAPSLVQQRTRLRHLLP